MYHHALQLYLNSGALSNMSPITKPLQKMLSAHRVPTCTLSFVRIETCQS